MARPTTYSFPFLGAGDATYFEQAELEVVLSRDVVKKVALLRGLPDPLVATVGKRHIYAGGGNPGDFTVAKTKTLNKGIDAWLASVHAQVPILFAYRKPDEEAGGTKLSAWHAWSVAHVPSILAALGSAKQPPTIQALVRVATAMARAAGVLVAGGDPFAELAALAKIGPDAHSRLGDAFAPFFKTHNRALCTLAPKLLAHGIADPVLFAKLAQAVLWSKDPSTKDVLAALGRAVAKKGPHRQPLINEVARAAVELEIRKPKLAAALRDAIGLPSSV